MPLAQQLNLGRILRRCAHEARSRAPGLFGRIASSRILRGVYRRLAHPGLYRSAVYAGQSDPLPAPVLDETTESYKAMMICLNRETAIWNPGKRIDA
jgi:hypothetical protein